MTETVDLDLVRFAELVWPAVDRAFIGGIRAAGPEGRRLVEEYGGRAVGYLIDLRNPLAAGRSLTPAQLADVYRYQEPAKIQEIVGRSVQHGLLARAPEGAVSATDTGRAFLRELFAQHAGALADRWVAHTERVERLNQTLHRLLAAAERTAGAAWAVCAPPYEPPGTPPGVLLLNRLSTLRYHRADAHAAAWQAAGLTAAEMIAMPPGADRDAIEHETNRLASPPYAELRPDERLAFLGDLAALP